MGTPAPGAYKAEDSEKYLEEKIQHSMGIKHFQPKKYVTPAPGAYKAEDSEKYLVEKIQHSMGIKPSDPKKYLDEKIQHSMGMKIKDPKKYITPAPNKYEAQIEDDSSYFSFGVKHSPYLYSGKDISNGSSFRSRSGTFTKA